MAYNRLQISSLGYINNILLNLELENIGDIRLLWNELANICAEAIKQVNLDILELSTGAMWTILRRCGEIPEQNPLVVEMIFTLAKLDQSEIVRSNTIGVISSLSHSSILPQIVVEIAKLFISSLNDNSYWVIAETINGIIDIFAETEYNEIVSQFNMINVLISFIPKLQEMIKQGTNNKIEEMLINRLEEAELNLPRFIEYKQSQF